MQKLRKEGRVVMDAPPPAAPAPPKQPPSFVPPAMPPEPVTATAGGMPASTDAKPFSPTKSAGLHFEDELDDYDYAPPSAEGERVWKRFVNSSLLLVEVAAVIGLVFLGVNLFTAINGLERETANAAAIADQQRRATIPTIAPTPQITLEAVVLPGGHTFTDSGAPTFNYSEVPSHLLPLVQDLVIAPPPRRPPPTDNTAVRLIVPQIEVDQTIIQGVDWEALRQGIGQLQNSTTPADVEGNLVLVAHNDIYGEYFRHLDQLEAGDQFQIQTATQIFTYTVSHWELVEPNEVQVMDARGGATATLISCYPYQVDNKRIVVYATRNV
jgi:sortase A